MKRFFDLLFSLMLLVILAPLMIIIVILIRIKLGIPIFFKQLRPGLHSEPFYIYKFRTLSDAKDENDNLLSDDQRLTNFGKFLRSSSLDELPELFNILIGDMSFVGPRPLLMEYLSLTLRNECRRISLDNPPVAL